jgi:cell division protein FtsL
MSIRMLASELYRVMQEVEKLERKLKEGSPGAPERDDLEQQLRQLRGERDRIKAMLEGAKGDE